MVYGIGISSLEFVNVVGVVNRGVVLFGWVIMNGINVIFGMLSFMFVN